LRTRIAAGTSTFAIAAFSFGTVLLSALPASADPGENRVTLCHETGSGSHPYVLLTVAEAAARGHEVHGDDVDHVHVDLEVGAPVSLDDCPAGASVLGNEALSADGSPATSSSTQQIPQAASVPAASSTSGQTAPAAGSPTPPSTSGQTAPAAGSPTPPSTSDSRLLAAANDFGSASADSQPEPAGGVAAGDGSSEANGSGLMPYVLGGVALAASGGAAFAARRSSRASD
jgi:hypothetical protein